MVSNDSKPVGIFGICVVHDDRGWEKMSKEKFREFLDKRRSRKSLIKALVLSAVLMGVLTLTIILTAPETDSRTVNQKLSDDLVLLSEEVGQEEYYNIMEDFHLIYARTYCFDNIQGYSVNIDDRIVEIYYPGGDTLIFSENRSLFLVEGEEVNITSWCGNQGVEL